MGICSSKKAVNVFDSTKEFTEIQSNQIPDPYQSRFDAEVLKAKLVVTDPNAIVDDQDDSDSHVEEDQDDNEEGDDVLMEEDKEDQIGDNQDSIDDNEEDSEEDEEDNDEAIRNLIQQLTSPNFNLIEKHLQNKKNHDLYVTQTTMIGNPQRRKSPNDLTKDYEKIPNRLHVPDQLANSRMNPNITIPSQPTTSLGLVGLYNLGNTCFINTAIQCLSSCQPLADYFISNLHYDEINENNALGCRGDMSKAYGKLVKLMWKQNTHSKIYPVRFCKVVEKYGSHFVNGAQQDTQEFLAFLLDCLHEDLNRANPRQISLNLQQLQPRKAPLIPQPSPKGVKLSLGLKKDDEEEAMESWKQYLQRNKSVVVDLFQGQLKSTLQCLVCGNSSTKFDGLMYLSVPIAANKDPNNPISLTECLQEFSKEEILDKENKWYCDKCKQPQPAKKKIDIWKLPSILIICLKRFKFNGNNQVNKISELVDFPLNNLDLSPYVSSPQREKPIYDLFSVANHEGTMTNGHYYAYSWNHASRNWYYYNDQEIKLIKNLQKIVAPEAYILFYSKTSIENFLRQTLRIPDYWPHVVNAVASKLNTFRGINKESKKQRHKIKQQIKSLKSSLSSFAMSGGFLSSKQQQNEFLIHLQSSQLLGANKYSSMTGFNTVKKKKNRRVNNYNKISVSKLPPQDNFNETNNNMFRNRQNAFSTATEKQPIQINNQVTNYVNNYYYNPDEIQVKSKSRSKKSKGPNIRIHNASPEHLRMKDPQLNNNNIYGQQENSKVKTNQLMDLNEIAHSSQYDLYIDNDSALDSQASLDKTGQFGAIAIEFSNNNKLNQIKKESKLEEGSLKNLFYKQATKDL